jgi:hypothetical protein
MKDNLMDESQPYEKFRQRKGATMTEKTTSPDEYDMAVDYRTACEDVSGSAPIVEVKFDSSTLHQFVRTSHNQTKPNETN